MNAKDLADAGKSATLTVGSNQQTHLPVRSGTIGPDVIDVGRLYRDTGCFTYDPGFTSTANCSSRITYIDGDKGVLLYRGYPIEQLAQRSNFLEVCYLLLNGDLPTKTPVRQFPQHRHAPHHGARADDAVLHRLPPRRAPDGRHVRLGRRAVAPSITTPPTSTIPSSASSPATA